MQLYQPTITGSLSISGSILLTGSMIFSTGSISGTASYSQNSDLLDNLDSTSFVFTSSYNPTSASFSTRTTTLEQASASFAVVSQSYSSASGSFSSRVTTIESKYATTGSNIFTSNQTICGNLTTTGTITAQTINVQQVTSSIVYSSGSNIFGCSLSNTQQMTGSVGITGSLFVQGPVTANNVACFTTVCSPTHLGGTFSGTTIYGSTAICGAVICGGATTLTGALSGTSATFSGDLTVNSEGITINRNAGNGYLLFQTGGVDIGSIYSNTGGGIRLRNATSDVLTIASTGAATFSGDVLITNSSNAQIGFNTTGALNSTGAYLYYNRSGSNKWTSGMGPVDGSNDFQIATGGVKALNLTVTTGAATFSSSVRSNTYFQARLDGSATIESGAAFEWANTAGNRAWVQQLGASNELFYSYYNGTSWSSPLVTILNSGNVGISETSPASKLSIGGTQGSTIGSNVALLVGNNGAAGTIGNMIQIGLHYNPAGATPASVIGAVFTSTSGYTKSDIFFATRDVTTDTAPTERMRITSGGNVGIGTTSPSTLLHMVGASATLIVADNTSYAAGVGGKLSLQGNYRNIGDITEGGYIKASKSNSTNGDYGFDMIFATQTYTSGVSEKMRITSGGIASFACQVCSPLVQQSSAPFFFATGLPGGNSAAGNVVPNWGTIGASRGLHGYCTTTGRMCACYDGVYTFNWAYLYQNATVACACFDDGYNLNGTFYYSGNRYKTWQLSWGDCYLAVKGAATVYLSRGQYFEVKTQNTGDTGLQWYGGTTWGYFTGAYIG